jgi:hypothetical protein
MTWGTGRPPDGMENWGPFLHMMWWQDEKQTVHLQILSVLRALPPLYFFVIPYSQQEYEVFCPVSDVYFIWWSDDNYPVSWK